MKFKNTLLPLVTICFLTLLSCRYQPPQTIGIDSVIDESEYVETYDSTEILNSEIKKQDTNSRSITLKEYVENLRNDGMTMFHIEGDNVLIFTRWDNPVGGNADSQAEALYRQAKAAHVRNIRTVRIMKMPEKKVVGRYVSRKK